MPEEATAPAVPPAPPPSTGDAPLSSEPTTGGSETIRPSSETPTSPLEPIPPFGETPPATGSSGGQGFELKAPRTTFSKAIVLDTVAVPRGLLERAAVMHTLDAGGRRSLAAEFRALL